MALDLKPVPVQVSRDFAAALRKAGYRPEALITPGTDHLSALYDAKVLDAIARIAGRLTRARSRPQPRRNRSIASGAAFAKRAFERLSRTSLTTSGSSDAGPSLKGRQRLRRRGGHRHAPRIAQRQPEDPSRLAARCRDR